MRALRSSAHQLVLGAAFPVLRHPGAGAPPRHHGPGALLPLCNGHTLAKQETKVRKLSVLLFPCVPSLSGENCSPVNLRRPSPRRAPAKPQSPTRCTQWSSPCCGLPPEPKPVWNQSPQHHFAISGDPAAERRRGKLKSGDLSRRPRAPSPLDRPI